MASDNAAGTKIIMGIDPGTNTMGYGIISVCGSRAECITLGDVDMKRMGDPYQKLRHIFDSVVKLIDEFHPDEVALESPFFGENVQSMLKLGRAQGVAMAAALSKGCPVAEYAPRRIKQSITGSGSASKEQVAGLLKGMLQLTEMPRRLDATDGVAVAMCHFYTTCSVIGSIGGEKKKALGGGRKSSSWESFVSHNPERIKK